MPRTRQQMRITVLASPKGGIGRSACSIALARALASRDRRVLVIDMSPWASLSIDMDLPAQTVQPIGNFQTVSTCISGLDYVCLMPDEPDSFIAKLRSLSQYDEIIIDNSAPEFECDVFLRADMPILIANPEPSVIIQSTIWLRKAFIRYVQRFEETDDLSSALSSEALTWTFDGVYNRLTPTQQTRFTEEVSAFRCAFLLNHRRENSEILQSRALCHAWGVSLGLDIRFMGSIQFDDRRWFYMRKLADISAFMREDPIVREMDSIVRETMNSTVFGMNSCLPLIQENQQPREFLRASTQEEARQNYRILWEGYRRENGLVSNILSHNTIAQTIAKLETAYKNSDLDPISSQPKTSVSDMPAITRSFSSTFAAARRIETKQTDSTPGCFLLKCREAAGISIRQLALKIRIPAKIIEKLESQDCQDIPPARLQAYLYEISIGLNINFDDLKKRFGLQ